MGRDGGEVEGGEKGNGGFAGSSDPPDVGILESLWAYQVVK